MSDINIRASAWYSEEIGGLEMSVSGLTPAETFALSEAIRPVIIEWINSNIKGAKDAPHHDLMRKGPLQ